MTQQKILLGITGGIAAYKSVLLVRELVKRGDSVRVVLTENAKQFVTTSTLHALTGEHVYDRLFNFPEENTVEHIALARWADIFLIAPASANTLAKFAHGIADNLLTTLYLACDAPIIIAPAMNQRMWHHAATQSNLSILAQRPNHTILATDSGLQACGEEGFGRMLAITDILESLVPSQLDLAGLSVVITAGPTREAIDAVRYLSNYSSGKMGYALAQAACKRGANVTLISGPTALSPPANCVFIPVTSALEMHQVALSKAPKADIFIAAAAVSDYRIAKPLTYKHKKTVHGALQLELVENPDIVADVALLPKDVRPFTVGFAAETGNLITHARNKLIQKSLDMIIANDVSTDVFGSDENTVTLLDAQTERTLPRSDKMCIANEIFTHLRNRIKDSL